MSPEGNWPQSPSLPQIEIQEVMTSVETKGIFVSPNALDPISVSILRRYVDNLDFEHNFKGSSIGKGGLNRIDTSVRSDKIYWITEFLGPMAVMGQWLNSLSTDLKNHFRVPVSDLEVHFSIYPSGAHYSKHIDNPQGKSLRLFTFIFYLNPDWTEGDGGELVVYHPENHEQEWLRIKPKGGTFVLFRSDLFPHEVLKAKRPRYTFTGWLRRYATI